LRLRKPEKFPEIHCQLEGRTGYKNSFSKKSYKIFFKKDNFSF